MDSTERAVYPQATGLGKALCVMGIFSYGGVQTLIHQWFYQPLCWYHFAVGDFHLKVLSFLGINAFHNKALHNFPYQGTF